MPYSVRKEVRGNVITLIIFGTLLVAVAVVMTVTLSSSGSAVSLGVAGLVCYAVAGFVAKMSHARSRQRRVLAPGDVVRFGNRRYYFTTVSGALLVVAGVPAAFVSVTFGPWALAAFIAAVILGRAVFILTVPPKGGRRSFEVTANELVIRTPEDRLSIPWQEVQFLFHRPLATTHEGAGMTAHREYLDLVLDDHRRIRVQGAHQQAKLSKLIIDQCREPLVRAMLSHFDRDGELGYGAFRFTHEGVHGSDGFLPWQTDFRIRHVNTEQGVALTITSPGKQEVTGWAPEEMIMLDILTALAQRHVHR